MAKRDRLTNSASEVELGDLLSTDSVFSIPYFQRPYKWGSDRLRKLEQDILQLVDKLVDNHFLGALIFHGRSTNPSDPKLYEVIDGQQRITTVFLYLCATIKTLCMRDQHDEALGLFLKYIVINRHTTLISNIRLHSCKDDRKQMNKVVQDILADEKFTSRIPAFKLKPLPALGSDRGRIWSNYKAALRFLSGQADLEHIERLRDIYTSLLEQISVVQIDVLDPVNGPKIFDSLNSNQEPMTTGDLVRNEIFARVANSEPTEVDWLDQQYWRPFYERFVLLDARTGKSTSLFDDYFFPFGLIKDPNLRKSGVYDYLRQHWKDEKEPQKIIKDLSRFQDAFLDLASWQNRQGHTGEVADAIRRIGYVTPTSAYPFLMQVLNGLKDGTLAEKVGIDVLCVLESFLVRRALCGHEPTGLHAVFKRLWDDCEGAPNASNVEQNVRKHKTVAWPSTSDVQECVLDRPQYDKSSVTKFVLVEWNRTLGGDQPTIEPWIEHVLPDSISPAWKPHFSQDQHKELKDTLANLLPLSEPMNRELSNAAYAIKKPKYLGDSMFKAAREFAKDNAEWTPDHIRQRAGALAQWVVGRWPY